MAAFFCRIVVVKVKKISDVPICIYNCYVMPMDVPKAIDCM